MKKSALVVLGLFMAGAAQAGLQENQKISLKTDIAINTGAASVSQMEERCREYAVTANERLDELASNSFDFNRTDVIVKPRTVQWSRFDRSYGFYARYVGCVLDFESTSPTRFFLQSRSEKLKSDCDVIVSRNEENRANWVYQVIEDVSGMFSKRCQVTLVELAVGQDDAAGRRGD